MNAEQAKRLYDKLSPFLNVEKEGRSVMEPWGCYPPKRNGKHDLRDWPLSSWRGPSTPPLVLSGSANPARRRGHSSNSAAHTRLILQ